MPLFKRIFRVVGGVAAWLSFISCGPSTPETPATVPGGGMKIQTFYSQGTGMTPVGNVQIVLDYVKDTQFNNYYAAGNDTKAISANTDGNGNYSNPDKRTPAYWTFVWGQNGSQPQCSTAFDNDYEVLVPPAAWGIFGVTCKDPPGDVELDPSIQSATFAPTAVNLDHKPTSVSATGSGFSATYGTQVVQFYDANANYVDEQYATTISSTELTFPFPSLTSDGPITPYLAVILNRDAKGDYYAVNTGVMRVFLTGGCKPDCVRGPGPGRSK